MWRAGPLWDCGNMVTKNGVVHLVDEDTEECSSLLIWVWLELGANLDDEGRSDS